MSPYTLNHRTSLIPFSSNYCNPPANYILHENSKFVMRSLSPVLREQGIILWGFEVFNFIEHIFDPCFWMYSMEPACDEKGIETRCTFCTFMWTGKQIIFAADDHRTNATFHRIVIYLCGNSGPVDQRFPAKFDHLSVRNFYFTFCEERLYYSEFDQNYRCESNLVKSIRNQVVNITGISNLSNPLRISVWPRYTKYRWCGLISSITSSPGNAPLPLE